MPRYIDGDALLSWAEKYYYNNIILLIGIKNAPTADVAPVVHGEWVFREYTSYGGTVYINYACSVCGRKMIGYSDLKDCPYCHCGAKMDLGVEK